MSAPPAATQLDPEAIDRLRHLDPSGGNRLLERVVAAFSTSLERLLPDLARARAAQPPDLNVVRHVSHTLKSSSASLGALQLSAICSEVEAQVRDGRSEGLDARLDALVAEAGQVRRALMALV